MGCDTLRHFFVKVTAVSLRIKHDIDLEILGKPKVELSFVKLSFACNSDCCAQIHLHPEQGKCTLCTHEQAQVHPFHTQARGTQPKSKFCHPQILPSTDQPLGEHIKGAHLQTKL